MKIFSKSSKGFTLFEVMAAFAILSILLYALYIVFDQASRVLNQGNQKTDQYQNARVVLDQMYRDISQIVLGQGGPNAVSNYSKNSSYLYGVAGTVKTLADPVGGGNVLYDRDEIYFSMPVEEGFNEMGYYLSSGNAGHVKNDYLQRYISSEDSSFMGFSVDAGAGSFANDEKYGFYITDLDIVYKVRGIGEFNEWDSRFNTINGTTATVVDDGRLPDSILITIKTVSKKALAEKNGIPNEGDKQTFTIEIPMTEGMTYQKPD